VGSVEKAKSLYELRTCRINLATCQEKPAYCDNTQSYKNRSDARDENNFKNNKQISKGKLKGAEWYIERQRLCPPLKFLDMMRIVHILFQAPEVVE
jgi:hypothetical protein